MKRIVQTLALTGLLLASASAASAQVQFGIRIGPPPPEQAYRVPARPGPNYIWIEGYQYPQGSHYAWHNGYWTLPPYEGAYWVEPYHSNGQYFAGRWEGSRGYVNHNHGWDKNKQRDEHRNPHPYDDRH